MCTWGEIILILHVNFLQRKWKEGEEDVLFGVFINCSFQFKMLEILALLPVLSLVFSFWNFFKRHFRRFCVMLDAKFYILLCGWLDFFFLLFWKKVCKFPGYGYWEPFKPFYINRALQTLHINVKPARVTNSGQDWLTWPRIMMYSYIPIYFSLLVIY